MTQSTTSCKSLRESASLQLINSILEARQVYQKVLTNSANNSAKEFLALEGDSANTDLNSTFNDNNEKEDWDFESQESNFEMEEFPVDDPKTCWVNKIEIMECSSAAKHFVEPARVIEKLNQICKRFFFFNFLSSFFTRA